MNEEKQEVRKESVEMETIESAPYEHNPMVPKLVSDRELLSMELPEIGWVIPEILPEGLTILAAKPKCGKSILSLGIALSVAAGSKALGAITATQGKVLYLSLEEGVRVTKQRLSQMTFSCCPRQELFFAYEWRRSDEGGLEALKEYLSENPDTRLVVIDTLARFRSLSPRGSNLYQKDYHEITSLKHIADDFGIALLVIHHLRKGQANDKVDLVSGSTGLTAAADNVYILTRSSAYSGVDAILHITGREMIETQIALAMDSETSTWHLLGYEDEFRMSQERREVLELLREEGEPMGLSAICTTLKKKRPVICKHLTRLTEDGLVVKVARGEYLASQPPERLRLVQ